MLTIGIDVGVSGAIAVVESNGSLVTLQDLPIVVYGKLKWVDAPELVSIIREARQGRPAQAFVEHVHAMPKLSTVAANAMGRTFGSVVAAVQMAGVSLELVSPQKWKRDLGVTSDKDGSLSRARCLFPTADLHRVKDHNRAEALLIVHYAQRHLQAARTPKAA